MSAPTSDEDGETSMPPSSALPSILSSSLLNTIRAHPQLPRHTWYFITGVTLSALNRPDEIPKVYSSAIEGVNLNDGANGEKSRHDEQLRISRKMREGLVKSAAINGLPKTINALLSLKSCTPPSLLDPPMGYSPSSRPLELYDMPSSTILHRGQRFFDQVYGKVSKRVMGQMDRCGTEDLGVTARLMYGYLLSNTSVLSEVESSWVLISGLIPQDVNPQLKGHLRGAINNGATPDEVRAVRDVVIRICEAAGMKRLDNNVPAGWGWREEVATV